MRKLFLYIRMGFMTSIIYRFQFLLLIFTNIISLLVNYFLWKAIYVDHHMLNGMTFATTFVYLSFAITLFMIYQTWLDWWVSRTILTGDIVVELLKPVDYFFQQIFASIGEALSTFVVLGLPTLLFFFVFFQNQLTFGLTHILFICSVLMGIIMSNTIDFMVGTCGFYTESIWGIFATKDAIVLFLSGAVIPLSFFPEKIRAVVLLLPFQAIYYTPLTILTSTDAELFHSLRMLGVQSGWCVLLFFCAKLLSDRMSRKLSVNGG